MLNIVHKIKGRCKGQSTVEYIILVSAVLAVAILFLTNSGTGFQAKLKDSMNAAVDRVGNMTDRMTNSHALAKKTDNSRDLTGRTNPVGWDLSRCPDGTPLPSDRRFCP